MSAKNILAFDIGGTKISSGVVSFGKSDFKILDRQKIKTPKNKDGVIRKLIELINYYQENNNFQKIGISFPGQVDAQNGVAVFAPSIKGWKNDNLKKIIKEKTGVNAEIGNDARCFALGENSFGRKKKYKNVVYLAIGTGIGGAIEINGKLYNGANNTAGEFGHLVIMSNGKKCGCGNRGCWEQYASGNAIEKLYFELYNKKKKAKEIALDSIKGIKRDQKVIKEISGYLSAGLASIINTINPEIIVIGGSVTKQKEILDLARKDVLKKVLIPARKTKIVRSGLGSRAMLVGAALLSN
ncbi:MAG: ROK family protein [Patescibacteria group bacterium]|nr:ROK family protein [Patescibacteria group bacterium]